MGHSRFVGSGNHHRAVAGYNGTGDMAHLFLGSIGYSRLRDDQIWIGIF